MVTKDGCSGEVSGGDFGRYMYIQEIFHISYFLYIPVSFDFISGQDSRQSSADRVTHFEGK